MALFKEAAVFAGITVLIFSCRDSFALGLRSVSYY